MGLDMYLNKRTYVQQWDHQKPEETYNVEVMLALTINSGGQSSHDLKDFFKIRYIIFISSDSHKFRSWIIYNDGKLCIVVSTLGNILIRLF